MGTLCVHLRAVNKCITITNAVKDGIKLTPIVGSYTPGYIYGTVKTHKCGNPIRPIISQVTSPIYKTARELDRIIKPYIPKKFSIKSREKILLIIRSQPPNGIIASLDVESLFTHVPFHETIEIILECVYNHATIAPPKLPKTILKELLLNVTTSSPFRSPDGKIYCQID